MLSSIPNPCSRCGKERTMSKTWTQTVGNFPLTRTITVCPDPECQKVINDEVLAQKEKREAIDMKKAKDKEDRAKLVASTISPSRN